jgi:RimJ/RimL family protein N-acetyltransferase
MLAGGAKGRLAQFASTASHLTVGTKGPSRAHLTGHTVSVVPLQPQHFSDLAPVLTGLKHAALWDYMFYGPFPTPESFQSYFSTITSSTDPLYFAITDNESNRAVGHASLMRIDKPNRVIEVGNIMFSPLMSRSTAGTEAMYLMARYVFEDLGYRRYEWKCNNLNTPSKRTAERLGFKFEGLFRQHMIIKGANRDTAWFSMLDSEWPIMKVAYEQWLDPQNFDASGRQLQRLEELRARPGEL